MARKLQSLLLFCTLATIAQAQEAKRQLGDPAPPLRVKEWVKGTPVQTFESGKVYIVEFWATWCKPCLASMPHLSSLAQKYKDQLEVVAIDVYECKSAKTNVQSFVNARRDWQDIKVAVEDTSATVRDWLIDSGEKNNGIPRTFVIDGQGRIVWIGHPTEVETVLPSILSNTWNIEVALSKKAADKRLEELDREAAYELGRFNGDYDDLSDLGKPDSILTIVDRMISKEPMLKYTPTVALFTFSALLKTNPADAYEYGKQVIQTATYTDPAYGMIISAIDNNSRKIKLPAEIYRLGVEAYQMKIDKAPYPELLDLPKIYKAMGTYYRRAGDINKAIDAEVRAVK